ncbi:MAG: hypothetical protein ACWA5U_03360 [bacterium]
MTFHPQILWGAIGGILPHLVQKAQQLVDSNANNALDAMVHPAYIVGLTFLALIGGVIVAIFREDDHRKALFLGISAPALITAAASAPNMQRVDDMQYQSHYTHDAPITLIGSVSHRINHQAFADEPITTVITTTPSEHPPSQVPETNKSASLDQTLNAENFRKQVLEQMPDDVGVIPQRYIEVYAVNQSEVFAIRFLNEQNEEIQRLKLPEKRHGLIAVPPEARLISFARGETASQTYPLPQQDSTLNSYFVQLEGKQIYDFWSAFGRAPKVEFNFKVLVKTPPAAPIDTEGWAYAGKFENGVWSGKLFDFPTNQLPRENQQYQVEYPLNLRKTPEKFAELLGQLHLNQEIRLLSLKPSKNNEYWVKIKVIK